MKILDKPNPWQVGIILAIGVIACSTAAIFIRLCIEVAQERGVGFSLFLAASRLTIAGLILLPTWKNLPGDRVDKRAYYYAAAAGFSLAVHFAFWTTSLSFTSIAAATALVTSNPVWVAILSWLFFKEKITKLTIVGMVVAILGSILIAFADQGSSSAGDNPLLGDLLALAGALAVAIYFLCGREAQRYGLGIGVYITFAYTTAALVLLPFPIVFGKGYFGHPSQVYFYLLLTAVISQLVGHSSLNLAVRSISPTIVTLCTLFEPIGSSFMGFLFFQEQPSPLVIVGGVLLLIGVAVAVLGKSKE